MCEKKKDKTILVGAPKTKVARHTILLVPILYEKVAQFWQEPLNKGWTI